jgi:Transcriptional regulatory protein, C terminal
MTLRISDVVATRAPIDCIGRDSELTFLERLLADDGPVIAGVHGIGGIGKSTLLSAFAARAQRLGVAVICLDCRAVEPTERGFLSELSTTVGADLRNPNDAAQALGQFATRLVLMLDTYERFRLMDSWLRRVFVPSLGNNVRIVLCGRDPMMTSWLTAPGWNGLTLTLALDTLCDRDALDLLERSQVSSTDARHIMRLTRGHPLALKLAATSVSGGRRTVDLESAVLPCVVEELTRLYVAEIGDVFTRRVLNAASVVRRTTLSLLGAMLPDASPQDAYEQLRSLPFVTISREGLHVHDTMQRTIAAALKAADPATYREHRRAAWRQLRAEFRDAGTSEMWRYTADMLYLIENPVTRDAFFPPNANLLAVETASPSDGPAIEAIVARHEGGEAARRLLVWWRRAPQAFRVVRDQQEALTGFYALFEASNLDSDVAITEADPIVGLWQAHLRDSPVPADARVLFCLRWLSAANGEAPSPDQGAIWLDMKRFYMEMRPHLRRIYMPVIDIATYGPIGAGLGFRVLEDSAARLDGRMYHTAMLDFGPQSVDGWLAGLLGTELGIEEEPLLDTDARELVLDGTRVPLTRREFAVMQMLTERPGTVISRTTLLDAIWGQDYEGGSNVVDAVIRLLRKKMGDRASSIGSVSGVGYRYRRKSDLL